MLILTYTNWSWGAILNGLQLANDKGEKKIIIKRDSSTVINTLTGQRDMRKNCNRMGNIIDECRRLINKNDKVKVVHVFREYNSGKHNGKNGPELR